MKLNYITNEDENLQEKIRYFADYFSFVNEFLGKLPDVPYDNPLSLISKTIFQIETNFDSCHPYIISYLSELFANNACELTNPIYSNLENHFKAFKGYKSYEEKKEWLNINTSFREELKLLEMEYQGNLFDKNFSTLLSFIKCKHPLKKHKKGIQYRTKILVSLFRLKGHSKTSLDTYISRIISNDEFRFPFPSSIIRIQTKEEYRASIKKFFENRDFDTQFEGLRNLFITEHHKSGFFFYVIENCIIDRGIIKDFKVCFEEVTFISPIHRDLRKLRKSIKDYDKKYNEKTFEVFFGKEKMLAYVKMGYEKKELKKDEGFRIVSEELLELNQYFKGNLSANNLHFFVYDSFESDLWSASTSLIKLQKNHINELDLNEFRNNSYEILRKVSSPAKPIILQSEKIFLKAFSRKEIEYYWIFVESIFAPLNKDAKYVRKSFCKILLNLLNELRFEFLFEIAKMLIPFSFDYKQENLSKEDLYLIHSEIIKNHNVDFDIYQYKGKIKKELLKDLLEYHKAFNSLSNSEKWRSYFTSLLLDLYAYRNSLLHSGEIEKYSKIKLTDVLPKLISRARWLIIKSCKQDSTLTHIELIEKLTKQIVYPLKEA